MHMMEVAKHVQMLMPVDASGISESRNFPHLAVTRNSFEVPGSGGASPVILTMAQDLPKINVEDEKGEVVSNDIKNIHRQTSEQKYVNKSADYDNSDTLNKESEGSHRSVESKSKYESSTEGKTSAMDESGHNSLESQSGKEIPDNASESSSTSTSSFRSLRRRQLSARVQQNLPKWPLPYPGEIMPQKKRHSLYQTRTDSLPINEGTLQKIRDGYWRTMRFTPGEIDLHNKFIDNTDLRSSVKYRVTHFPREETPQAVNEDMDTDKLNMKHLVNVLDDENPRTILNSKRRIQHLLEASKKSYPTVVEVALKAARQHRRLENQRLALAEIGGDLKGDESLTRPKPATIMPVEKILKDKSATYEALQRSKYNRLVVFPENSFPYASPWQGTENVALKKTAEPLSGILHHKSATFHSQPTQDATLWNLEADGNGKSNSARLPGLNVIKPFRQKKTRIMCEDCVSKAAAYETVDEFGRTSSGRVKKTLNIFIPSQPE